MELLTKENCLQGVDIIETNLEGLYVVIKPEKLTEKYRQPKYQLVKCVCGFGCNPTSLGNAIFVKEMHTDNPETYRRERYNNNFIGIANEETIKQFKDNFGWND